MTDLSAERISHFQYLDRQATNYMRFFLIAVLGRITSYNVCYTKLLRRTFVVGGPVSLEGGLFGGPVVNVLVALAIGFATVFAGDRIPILDRIRPTKQVARAMMTFAGQGAVSYNFV